MLSTELIVVVISKGDTLASKDPLNPTLFIIMLVVCPIGPLTKTRFSDIMHLYTLVF